MKKLEIIAAALSCAACLAAGYVLYELRLAVRQVGFLDEQMEQDHRELVRRVIAAERTRETGYDYSQDE